MYAGTANINENESFGHGFSNNQYINSIYLQTVEKKKIHQNKTKYFCLFHYHHQHHHRKSFTVALAFVFGNKSTIFEEKKKLRTQNVDIMPQFE